MSASTPPTRRGRRMPAEMRCAPSLPASKVQSARRKPCRGEACLAPTNDGPSSGFEPIHDNVGNLVAVRFHHQHVTVADDAAVAEKAELSRSAVGIEPSDNGAV